MPRSDQLLAMATVRAVSEGLLELVLRVKVAVVPALSAKLFDVSASVSVGTFVSSSVAVSGIER